MEGICATWEMHDKIKHKFHKNFKQRHYLYFWPDVIRVNDLRNVKF